MEDSNLQETIADLHVGFLDRCATITQIFRIVKVAELPFYGTLIGVISQLQGVSPSAYLPSNGSPRTVTHGTLQPMALAQTDGFEPPHRGFKGPCLHRLAMSVCLQMVGVEPTYRNTTIHAESNGFSSSNPANDGTTFVLHLHIPRCAASFRQPLPLRGNT